VFYDDKVIYSVETQHVLIINTINLTTWQSQELITRKQPFCELNQFLIRC